MRVSAARVEKMHVAAVDPIRSMLGEPRRVMLRLRLSLRRGHDRGD
jgi:hypothetical protein